MVALFAIVTGTLGELSFRGMGEGGISVPSPQCTIVFGIINFSHLVKICGGKWYSIWTAKHHELLDSNMVASGFIEENGALEMRFDV